MNLSSLSPDRIQHEISENPRLRSGLWLILFIILTWGSLVWSDYNLSRYKAVRSLERDLVALSEIESAAVWQQRAAKADQSVKLYQQQFGLSESPGLAMAKLQSDLSLLTDESQGVGVKIKVGTPQYLAHIKASRIRARVRLSLTPEALITFLTKLSHEPRIISIEQLNIDMKRGRWVVDATVVSYFIIEGQQT